ncbi:hypothetical protein ACROYT_G007399 [Oculina patagonica]
MTNSTTKSAANSSSAPIVCFAMDCTFTRGELDFIAFSLFSIAAISLLGNIPILISILFNSKRRNSSNLATLNLVVSDLLITIFCIPFVTLDMYVFDFWMFGHIMCPLVTFVQNTAVLASLMNLLTITCEKFLAVRFPFHVRLRKKLVCHFMPVAWIIAVVESGFYVQYKKMKEVDENKFHCMEDWPDSHTYENAIIAKLALFFGPLILITILHSITIYTLVKRKRCFNLQQNRSERESFRKTLSKHKRQRKAVKIILLTLISIIICWSPVYVFMFVLMFDFVSSKVTYNSMNIGFTVCIWLLFSHCSVFPLIFFFLTQKGKETIAFCSLCLKTCRLQGNSSNMGTLLLDSSNNHGGSFRTTGRYSSWRRSSTPGAETRL